MACQSQDISEDIIDMGSDSRHSGILSGLKVEYETFTSDFRSFLPTMINIDNDEFSEYKKEEHCVTWEEGTTSSSRNMETNPVQDDLAKSSSSSYELTSEVDLGVMKLEEDEVATCEPNEREDRESGKQYLTHRIGSVKHRRLLGEKIAKTFDCIKCKKKFQSKFGLHGHVVARHSNNSKMMNSLTCKIHRCKHCGYITANASSFTKHMRKHGEKAEKTFDCVRCKKEFLSKQNLDSHIVSRHSNDGEMINSVTCKMHRCKHCSHVTINATCLTTHMRTHGEKPKKTFDCVKCNKEFLSKQSLDSHIVARHSNDGEMINSITSKIHRCKHCSYVTVNATWLTTHMRTHGEKPKKTFDCVKCKKEFLRKRHLHGHIATRHSNDGEMMNSITSKIHRCKHCSYVTVNTTGLTQHMRTHEETPKKNI